MTLVWGGRDTGRDVEPHLRPASSSAACVLAEAIEVRDQQLGPVDAAGLNGADRLRAIDALAALHLGELVDELTGAIGEEASDHLALHIESRAERALTGGARVVVGDQGAGWNCRITS
jgi:hypothetical protein